MKQTLQLRLGQHLTMTPQLQQAIRLLQLSALDLNQEIQEALDTNPMLEAEEEFEQTATERKENPSSESAQQTPADGNDINNEREVKTDSPEMPEDLPVDTEWNDVYDSYSPPAPAGGEGSDTDFLSQRSKSDSLQDHLLWQLNLTRLCPSDQAIALTIIDSISPDGYLQASIEEIHSTVDLEEVTLEDVEAVLHRVQAFDPPGIAARGPQECLLIQLDQLPPETAYLEQAIQLCSTHFKLLAAQDQAQIKRKMKIDDHELSAINQLIRSLHPRPGTLIADTEPEYVIPEVFVTKRNNSWHVELNPETMPRLRVNAEYAKLIRRADQSDDNTFLKNHLQEARWFLKSLLSRNETILRVASKIVEYQQAFFEHGEEAMKPLVLRDIAEALEMHESTISRVTTQKYMHTPRGTLEFKYFFSSHVSTSVGGECSATAIRAIKRLL